MSLHAFWFVYILIPGKEEWVLVTASSTHVSRLSFRFLWLCYDYDLTLPTTYQFKSQINVRVTTAYNIFSRRLEENATSLFPPVNWWKFFLAQIASCRNVNHVNHLNHENHVIWKVISKLIEVTVVMVYQGKIQRGSSNLHVSIWSDIAR